MRIRLKAAQFGCYLLVAESGASQLIQTDWEFPGVASNFGWVPCWCGATDGTVNCPHRTTAEMIVEARDWLEANIGESTDDPGYFSQ